MAKKSGAPGEGHSIYTQPINIDSFTTQFH